jgi:hypothetical protein
VGAAADRAGGGLRNPRRDLSAIATGLTTQAGFSLNSLIHIPLFVTGMMLQHSAG